MAARWIRRAGSEIVRLRFARPGALPEIAFLMESDPVVKLGVEPRNALFDKLRAGEKLSIEESGALFAFAIGFIRDDWPTDDPTGARYLREHGARELGLDFEVVLHRRYRIFVQYPTGDPRPGRAW